MPDSAPRSAASPTAGARLAALFGSPAVVIREATLAGPPEPLYGEEAALVAGASSKRQREFAAARCCARQALSELGVTGFPLLAGADRAPIWPGQIVGSITHTDGVEGGYCGVAVASRSFAVGLGIDAEPWLPLPAEIWPQVLDDDENRAAVAAADPGRFARLIFSAKEATYKAVYPTLGRFLDFHDVHVRLLPEPGRFASELGVAAPGLGPVHGALDGRFVMDDVLLVTGVLLPTSRPPSAQEGLSPHPVPC